jgi:glutathione synthase/RimK-type ligase-like ATP-grasp enzyme
MSVKLYAYNNHSESAKSIAEELNIKRIRHTNSSYRGSSGDVIINWGHSGSKLDKYAERGVIVVNKPDSVANASNKLKFLNLCKGNPLFNIPDFTEEIDEASSWIDQGFTVMVRTVLNGHSGQGIIIAENDEDLVDAPLYTKFIPKRLEYRVHVLNGEVIDLQQKIRDPNKEITNWKIRNHEAGFMYIRNLSSESPPCVALGAVECVTNTLNLDFGAVDVIYNSVRGKSYILEVNTAPGVTGSSVGIYASALKTYFT